MFKKPKAKTRKNPGTKAGGRKAAKTRAKNAARRSAAGRKAARTRKANHSKRSRAAKRGAAHRGGKRGRPRKNIAAGVGARIGGLKAGAGARVSARSNPSVSAARVAKVEHKLTQVVKTQHAQGKKIQHLSTRVTRLDGARKALGLPAGGGSLRKAEDLLQERAVAMELAARRKNPKHGKKHGGKKGHKRGSKRRGHKR
jgi:hypothetical protein